MVNMGRTEMNRLQKAHNRAIRTILQVDRYTRIKDMLEALRFMSIRQRLEYKYNINIFIYKALHELLPREILGRMELVGKGNGMRTRQKLNIKIDLRTSKA